MGQRTKNAYHRTSLREDDENRTDWKYRRSPSPRFESPYPHVHFDFANHCHENSYHTITIKYVATTDEAYCGGNRSRFHVLYSGDCGAFHTGLNNVFFLDHMTFQNEEKPQSTTVRNDFYVAWQNSRARYVRSMKNWKRQWERTKAVGLYGPNVRSEGICRLVQVVFKTMNTRLGRITETTTGIDDPDLRYVGWMIRWRSTTMGNIA